MTVDNPEVVWLPAGEYKVAREFDENRYMLLTDQGYTLVKKSLTRELDLA